MVVVELEGCRFEFDHIQFKAGGMDAVLTVFRAPPKDPVEADGFVSKPFRYHISGRSLSNITAYRRELEKFHGSDIEWGRLIHEALVAAEQVFKEEAQSLDPWEQEGYDTESLVLDVFPRNQVSCVFGMGESAKSLGLEAMGAAISRGATYLGRQTQQSNILWLDYENEHAGMFGIRRQALSLGGLEYYPGSIRWMPARGIPLPDLVDVLAREMQRFHIGVLVVDSVAFACGGKPEVAESATTFYSALAQLPLSTKLLIAHTDKAENDKYPFGSIFWHNGIHGASWFVKATQETGEVVQGWYLRKNSEGPRPGDFAVKYIFKDDVITVEPGNLAHFNRETGRESTGVMVKRALLTYGRLTAKEISDETGITQKIVSTELSRMKTLGTVKNDGYGRPWYVVDEYRSEG